MSWHFETYCRHRIPMSWRAPNRMNANVESGEPCVHVDVFVETGEKHVNVSAKYANWSGYARCANPCCNTKSNQKPLSTESCIMMDNSRCQRKQRWRNLLVCSLNWSECGRSYVDYFLFVHKFCLLFAVRSLVAANLKCSTRVLWSCFAFCFGDCCSALFLCWSLSSLSFHYLTSFCFCILAKHWPTFLGYWRFGNFACFISTFLWCAGHCYHFHFIIWLHSVFVLVIVITFVSLFDFILLLYFG